MNKAILILLTSLWTITSYAQTSGTITYRETIKMDLQIDGDQLGGIDLSQYLPEAATSYKDLHFNKNRSVYKDGQGEEAIEDTEIESDDGSFKMTIQHDDDTEEIIYMDYNKKESVKQTGFMGKEFLIENKIEKLQWKISGEKVKYLDYECIKATSTYDDNDIVAWFAPQLPSQVGPQQYGQLPGAILMLSVDEGKTEIMASSIVLVDTADLIKKPSKGKAVSAAEFDKIVEDKLDEMKSQFKGENTFIIRG